MNVVTQEKSPRRMPGIPEHVQEYFLCILFHLLLPFMPLVTEAAVLGHVENKTLLLFLAIYPLSIGVSSRSRLMFGVTIVISLMFSVFFGLLAGGASLSAATYPIGYLCLATVILIHGCERYNRHVVDQDLFWEFNKSESHS